MEVRELGRGAILDELDAALLRLALAEVLEALLGLDQEHRSRRLDDFAVLHLGDDDWRHRRVRRDDRRPFHARLQVARGQLLAVDGELETLRHHDFPRAFRQLDDQVVAAGRDHLERFRL